MLGTPHQTPIAMQISTQYVTRHEAINMGYFLYTGEFLGVLLRS